MRLTHAQQETGDLAISRCILEELKLAPPWSACLVWMLQEKPLEATEAQAVIDDTAGGELSKSEMGSHIRELNERSKVDLESIRAFSCSLQLVACSV